ITAPLPSRTTIRSAARSILTLVTGTAGGASLLQGLATGSSAATSRPHTDDAPIPGSRHRATELAPDLMRSGWRSHLPWLRPALREGLVVFVPTRGREASMASSIPAIQ